MSESNNHISKRKGSPEPTEFSSSTHKRLKADSTSTSGQAREGHAQDCTEADCEGCADGEIEINFDHEPTAFELFQMARDEAAKEGIKGGPGAAGEEGDAESGASRGTTSTSMAKKLFDMAIEAFEKLEQARRALPKDQQDSHEMVEERIKHAACEVAVGVYMPAVAMVEEGLAKYEQLIRTEVAASMGSAWVGLAIARISTARLQRKATIDLVQQELEDLDEGTDEYEEAHLKGAEIGDKEHSLVTKAMEAFDKGLGLMKEQDPILLAKESIRAAQELDEYGASVDLGLNATFAHRIFKTAIAHLKNAQKVNADLVDDNADALTIYGSCLFHLARIADQTGYEVGESTLLQQAIEHLTKAEKILGDQEDAKTLELLGQVYLMSITTIEDEDEIMKTYDAATAKLKRALELDPDNASLRRQLEAIETGEEQGEDDEDYDDEDDDDNGDESFQSDEKGDEDADQDEEDE